MTRPATVVRNWLRLASPQDARDLARFAKTSVPHLRHIAAGRRGISPELAQRLAHGSGNFNPIFQLSQTELCRTCARCPLAKAAARR